MASFVRLRNNNPLGAVTVLVDGDRHDVDAGGVLTVTPEAAGRAPGWRKATEAEQRQIESHGPVQQDETGAPDYPRHSYLTGLDYRQHAGDVEVFDLGEGLLAQSENWQPAGGRAAAPKDDEPVQIQSDHQAAAGGSDQQKGGE